MYSIEDFRWIYMWQFHIEIDGYSITYFDHITAFKAPYCWTSIKGGAHMHFVDSLDIHESTKLVWAPPLTEVQAYVASSTAMRSKYMTEKPSVSTQNNHTCNSKTLMWVQWSSIWFAGSFSEGETQSGARSFQETNWGRGPLPSASKGCYTWGVCMCVSM